MADTYENKVSISKDIKAHPAHAPIMPTVEEEVLVDSTADPVAHKLLDATPANSPDDTFALPANIFRDEDDRVEGLITADEILKTCPMNECCMPEPVHASAPEIATNKATAARNIDNEVVISLSIFLLGLLSGASIVYAFSKPVIVHGV